MVQCAGMVDGLSLNGLSSGEAVQIVDELFYARSRFRDYIPQRTGCLLCNRRTDCVDIWRNPTIPFCPFLCIRGDFRRSFRCISQRVHFLRYAVVRHNEAQ
jgi:hypothetical protein